MAEFLGHITELLNQDRRFNMTSTKIGGAPPELTVGGVDSLLIPSPPVMEQRRIVAKKRELIALCDQPEAKLTRAIDTRHNLLGAILHEALSA